MNYQQAKTRADILKALAEALATVQTNRPVHDNRTTPDAEAARQEAYTRTAAEAKAKAERSAAAFTARYGSGEKVTLQLGQMAVLAQICYDNSDTMSDYFDRHTSLSQAFVLAIVPKQSETERLARRGAAASLCFPRSTSSGTQKNIPWVTATI